jgi:hypothetical protein
MHSCSSALKSALTCRCPRSGPLCGKGGKMIRTLSAGLMFVVGLGSGIAHAAEGISLNPQYNPALFKAKDPTVDPDNSIYGIKFGATEKNFWTPSVCRMACLS